MAVKVLIPTPLRQFTGKQSSIECSAATVGEALGSLTGTFSELRKHLFTDEGKIRSFVNVYLKMATRSASCLPSPAVPAVTASRSAKRTEKLEENVRGNSD
jgi:molybdopterin converting factor small subunit